jgi:peptidoglycan/xylan/chitin deacetylase (PgdA/CDA1 family)
LLKSLFSVVSPAGPRARLSILIFHRVLPQPDPLFPGEVDAARFDAICGWLRRWHQVLPLADAVARLRSGSLPARALAVTFDDGYADNHDVALPILQRHGLPATFFVASGFLDGGCMWNDQVIEAVRHCRLDELPALATEGFETGALPLHDWSHKRMAIDQLLDALKYLAPELRAQAASAVARAAGTAPPSGLMMSPPQVAALAASTGMSVGGHTVTHPILARLDEAAALAEMRQGKHALESITQQEVSLFAYPNGRPGRDYTERDVRLAARAGFAAAVSTRWGASSAASSPYELPRFTPWDRTALRFGVRLAWNTTRVVVAGAGQLPLAAQRGAVAPQ